MTAAAAMTRKLVVQALEVVSGNRIIPDHIVSFFDPDARPIKKASSEIRLSLVTRYALTKPRAAL